MIMGIEQESVISIFAAVGWLGEVATHSTRKWAGEQAGDRPRHEATGEEGAVEIESRWTARRREQLGVYPLVRRRDVS
jgi:hypothetical protein